MKRQDEALLIVDVQNDFCPGGALGVPGGNTVVRVINRLMPYFDFILASKDWHPPGHVSFRERGGPWPPHCVQGSSGAELHPELDTYRINSVLHKATSPDVDAYSAFEAKDERGRSLNDLLTSHGLKRLYVAGLATDYCVRETAMDGLLKNYEVFVIEDGVRPVDVRPGDGERALAEIAQAGGRIIQSREILDQEKSAEAAGS